MMHRRAQQQGFTLIEIIAAFTILAMTFMVVLEILSNSSANTIKSSERTEIALEANSKLAEIGTTIPIEEGSVSGDFENGHRWDIRMVPYEISYEGDTVMDFAPIELFHITLTIRWDYGGYQERVAEFNSLRAVAADFAERP
ncbi:type IV pilus modification PilV family protein [Marinicella gelatinilytica]|uniref:type IV pilus modification PilV family protein n=1 Tax=Marinicella gelatinilytica TaxID=2996017 RepID=UPI002260BA59|nr:prepilin-type N-terminal cleavage/methylation domain-containing protein [Marinicella gelatinilytica]MCX7544084.1 prepilin-type N-terminal cleavage/methylation domain-containing protein [Marinicella gelatinilytica]